MLEHKDDYVNQTILGRRCKAGDDRHMTGLFLFSGHRVGWTSWARCWTNIPMTISALIKQQMRWVRSHTAEMFFLMSCKGWTLPFAFFATKLMFNYAYRATMFAVLIISIISGQALVPLILVFGGMFGSLIVKLIMEHFWGQDLLHGEAGKLRHLLSYALFDFFVLTPVISYAIFTPWKVGWLTRGRLEDSV